MLDVSLACIDLLCFGSRARLSLVNVVFTSVLIGRAAWLRIFRSAVAYVEDAGYSERGRIMNEVMLKSTMLNTNTQAQQAKQAGELGRLYTEVI